VPRFPSFVKSWRTNWVNLIPFFDYPPEIRKVTYLALSRISMKWNRPDLDWVTALNHFSVVFDGKV
jgi:putative transposase